jgi:hypothetical protein
MRFAQLVAGTRRPSQRIFFRITVVALAVSAALAQVRGQNPPKTHTIQVKFDYSFKRFHGCKEKNKAPCVKEFEVYNVTDTGRRYLLFSIPAPPGAKGEIKGITGASKPLVLAPGQHMIAVTAKTDRGAESDPRACSAMVNVTP